MAYSVSPHRIWFRPVAEGVTLQLFEYFGREDSIGELWPLLLCPGSGDRDSPVGSS